MNCQDNSRLKVPLPELCKTTDIGCVPMSSGKPDCPPEADQLPLAYDKESQTLWLFDCDTRDWVGQTKFQLAELQEVSLDNIRNICELLKIPVYYNPGGGTVQGSIPLGEFGEKLLSCTTLKNKVAILPTGDVAFSIEGLENLDPLYTRWENLTVSGDGTSASPLVVKAQDPLTKWPRATEEDVESAAQPMLAANLDGEMVQVPYPKKPCEYQVITRETLASAGQAFILGCVDNAGALMPFPEEPKDYDSATQTEVDGAQGKWLVAIIDGKQRRIPFPKEACEYDRLTAEEVRAALRRDVIACVDGEEVKIPLGDLASLVRQEQEQQGETDTVCDLPFATLDELEAATRKTIGMCVAGKMRQVVVDDSIFRGLQIPNIPVVITEPSGPPADGFPFRIDCDGNLWIWDATAQDWLKFENSGSAPGSEVPSYSSISNNINNSCTDTIFRGYYIDSTNPGGGFTQMKLTSGELAQVVHSCNTIASDASKSYSNVIGNIGNTCTDISLIGYYKDKNDTGGPMKAMSINPTELSRLVTSSCVDNIDMAVCYEVWNGTNGGGCVYVGLNSEAIVIQARDTGTGSQIIYGDGEIKIGSSFIGTFTATNPFNHKALFQIDLNYELVLPQRPETDSFNINSVCVINENLNTNYEDLFGGDLLIADSSIGSVNLTQDDVLYRPGSGALVGAVKVQASQYTRLMDPGETITCYLNHWETLRATGTNPHFLYHVTCWSKARIFNRYYVG